MKPHSFARIFLNTVQAEFEGLLAKLESGQTGLSTHNTELELGVETKRTSETLRALMMFMGHLFLKQLLALRVLDHVVEELIGLHDAARPWPEGYRIECVCERFRIVGCKLDETARGTEMFSTLACRLRRLTPSTKAWQNQFAAGESIFSLTACCGYVSVPDSVAV